jgi:hypothetical protein
MLATIDSHIPRRSNGSGIGFPRLSDYFRYAQFAGCLEPLGFPDPLDGGTTIARMALGNEKFAKEAAGQ